MENNELKFLEYQNFQKNNKYLIKIFITLNSSTINQMLNRFREHIEKLKLFSSSDTILVGVSGGTDSVVLLDLLDKAGLSVAMAHCNFNLRGEESLRDENFVKSLARQYDKPFHLASFDTRQFAVERGISIEMAARELRYHWFEELCEKNHYDWVAVAHHRDDQLETFS
jgi:Predicted ATPase of the PP-loop superfamily implicated in cell cycle control